MNTKSKEYTDIHNWIKKEKGKPKICESCSKTTGMIDWSNISGEYKYELSDWQRLCRSCHFKFDIERHTALKRPTIDDVTLPVWIENGRAKQNGFGWKDFDLFCEIKMPCVVLGRVFNKSNKTIKHWKQLRDSLTA